MLNKVCFPGKYIQGAGALSELPALAQSFGKRALLLASPTVLHKLLPESDVPMQDDWLTAELFHGECSERELLRLELVIGERSCDVLIGMGGGKTIDAAKIAADRAGIPVIIVPTIASTDAPCSGCAVLYSDDGAFESVAYQQSNPAAVLVDLNIIAKAPARFLVAGMGDALATWFEARSCSASKSANSCGGLSTLTGLSLARLCYETLLKYGNAARIAAEQRVITPALEHIVEANILLSGVGFESGGLASAHSIHNGLTALPETHDVYHGEKVAFGALAGLHLNDADPEEIETVYSFCAEVGLPTTLADLGLENADAETLRPAAEKACEPSECIHNEAGAITPRKVLHAMLAADACGRQRKQQR